MLNLYRNITPNLSGTHYYFKVFSRYVTLLASNLFKQIDETRYDINKGFIRVKLGTDLTEANYKEVTYILNTTDNICYHVSSQIVQSGYVYYGVNVDLWASYIVNAKLKNINVKKCNRKISDNGIYDSIKDNNNINYDYIGDNTINVNNLYVLFLVKIPPTSATNYTRYFNIIITINELYRIAPHIFANVEMFYKDITNLVSNISPLLTEIHTPEENFLNAEVVSTWLLSNEMINLSNSSQVDYIVFKGVLGATENAQGYILWTSLVEKNVEKQYNINNDYKIGTINNGVNIIRQVNNIIKAKYIFTLDKEGFNAFITIGNTQLDITNSFNVTFPKDSDDNRNVTKQLKRIATALIPTTLNPFRYLAKLGTLPLHLEDDNSTPSQLNGLGNADITYNIPNDRNNVKNPFVISVTTSLLDESKRVRKTGANFNEYIDELEDIFNYSLLGTGEVNDDTFIVASLDANEIPTSAVDSIEGRFASGVYLQYLL